jgi:hypothetical protein
MSLPEIILLSTMVMCFPLVATSLVWGVSLGAFDYFEVIHHPMMTFINIVFVLVGLVIGADKLIDEKD